MRASLRSQHNDSVSDKQQGLFFGIIIELSKKG